MGGFGLTAGSIGISALQSFIGGRGARKQAQAQAALQKAQHYQQNAREYAQLTESIKAQGRQNEAVAKAEAYTMSNLLSNKGAMKLRDSQLQSVIARNKLMLRRSGKTAQSGAAADAAALGAIGNSVEAMQRDIQKNVDTAMSDLEETRRNQVYDFNRQAEVMFTQFYQNPTEIDTSEINPAFLPQDPIMIGSTAGHGGGFLPHLIASGLNFTANHLMQEWSLDLQKPNASSAGGITFPPQYQGTQQSYPYRGY